MTTINPYQHQAVATATPAQLVLMLYDGALTAIARARNAHTEGMQGMEVVNRELQRAQAILNELLITLDREQGGAIAQSLAGLYDFCIERLVQANTSKQLDGLTPVEEVVRDLRNAWESACCRQVAATG